MSQPAASVEERQAEHRITARWHRRRLTVLAIGVLVAAMIAVGGFALLRDSDRAFRAGYGIRMERPVGLRIWTVLEHGRTAPRGVVTLDRIEPHIVGDEAEVEVKYAICHLDADALAADGASGNGYGLRDADVQRYCSRLVPAEGSSIELGTKPGQELLISVRTTRPGRSVVESHHIEFSEGWERGTADIEVKVDITAR